MGSSGSRLDPPPRWKPDEIPSYDDKKGPFWTEDGKGERPIIFAKVGPASEKEGPSQSIPHLFKQARDHFGPHPALLVERPCPPLVDGKAPPAIPRHLWFHWTWDQYYTDCQRGAKALISLGFEQHDAVNVFGFNAAEWLISSNMCMMAGGKVAGIYPSDTPEQVTFKCKHSGAVAFCVESVQKMEAILKHIETLPKLRVFVVWGLKEGEKPPKDRVVRKDGSEVRIFAWNDFLKLGDSVEEKRLQERDALIRPSHCCALIYTSGTTGNPKAVMITHDNVLFEAIALTYANPFLGDKPERTVSYLPLSHVAGMLVDIVAPIFLTATKKAWSEIYFARPYDLKVGSIGERLRCVRPTQFLGVPYVWQKISEKMKEAAAKLEGAQKWVGAWAKKKGLEHARECQVGGSGAYPTGYSQAAIVFGRVKRTLGLDECRFGLTGAAPIAVETLEYFGALGIQINELYGMSESTGCATISTDVCHQWGSCGYSMTGTETKCFIVDPTTGKKTACPPCADIFKPEERHQGELCFRGRHVMLGYLANPDLGEEHVAEIRKKNAEAIDDEGWLHSGDKGCVSTKGMFRITGRYKELIIGSGGENIAPVPIEDGVKKSAEGISNIMMVGDKRKFCVALVTLKTKGATGELPGGNDLTGPALLVSPETKTVSAALKDPVWHKYITDHIVATNKQNSPPSHIQRFTILPLDFSTKTGELTPTLKLKRAHVEKQWQKTIEALYNEDAPKTQAYFPCDMSECSATPDEAKGEPVQEQTFVVSNPEELAMPQDQLDELSRQRAMTGVPSASGVSGDASDKPDKPEPVDKPVEKQVETKE